ncbi:hypothetical protein [Pedobacter sp. SYSU D00535]|uniref:hypothetical protein n=1 Tax=Pedobacter sp. SYSU D00535 TaxID=2810308 RepID=UPI001A962054|nr:hypothetical protein [Pedobacter sp. SYSU D00535]
MKKILYLFLLVSVITSCKKSSDGFDEPNDSKEKQPEVFILKAISYSMEEGDGEEIITILQKPVTVENKSNAHGTTFFDSFEEIKETSHFSSSDSMAFPEFDLDSVKVSVPVQLLSDNQVAVGSSKWLYEPGVVELPSGKTQVNTLSYTPYTRITVNSSLKIKKYTLTYKATLVNQNTGKEVEVKGKWRGTTPFGSDLKIEYQEIK